MEKIIKKQGNSNMIRLNADDMKIHNLKAGDIVDVEICKKRNRAEVKA